jgi:molybdate transport system ATP-binding protein
MEDRVALEVHIVKKLKKFKLEVDFIAQKEVFAILGASGCGKSMTLKCIAGIETPDEGRIVLDDKVLFDSKKRINLPPQKRKVGYMFQDYALFPNMTVQKNIMAGMGRRPDLKLVEQYMKQFHVEELKDHYPQQLSGGQKQRVAMARLIAQKPEVILLDEPFSALDSYLKWELEQEMADILSKVGKTTLFVSHNRDEVYRLSDRIGCMSQGKMEVVEPVKEFFAHPKTRTAALLSGCKNLSAAQIVDDTHVLAKDWNVILCVNSPIPQDLKAVGIRAHAFSPGETENIFPVKDYRITEELFSWLVSYRTEEGSQWVQWQVDKSVDACVQVPETLGVKAEDILLLT